nr:plasma-membrane proton-efflux P-type ATPase [Candidatus Freyarchaeota archaeon]
MKRSDDGLSKQFTTNLENGLSLKEVQKRTSEYGYNEVPEIKERRITRFARKFWGPIAWMLEITILLCLLLGKYFEAIVVSFLLIFNSVIGFAQEEKANSALDFLKQKLRISAKVKRDGMWIMIPARELVPGDVVRLRAGDFVPADVEVAEGTVEVDQSALTGESLFVDKNIKDVLFSGSTIRRGEITGVVTSTGTKTYFGKTVELVQIAKPKSHMEEVISRVTKWLIVMIGILLLIEFAFAILKSINLLAILPLAVVLLMSAVPVALPTMFAISMALGSLELAKEGVLVTRLSANEDSASMDVLCADKTGTMTMNKLSVTDIKAVEDYKKEDVILYGALASQEANQDPIDLAFMSAARNMKIPLDSYSQKNFVPFDPSTRRTEATIERDGQKFLVTKGAINAIASLSNNCQEECSKLGKDVEDLSARGYRVLAVAEGTTKNSISLVGIVALYDKPRPDSPTLVKELRELGISVKMLTGDAQPIAKEVAEQLGLGDNITKMSDLKDTKREDKRSRIIEQSDGFAEIYPEDKYHIVESLQKSNHTVGMTGDGVNDAPALKQAEVGIAVSNATDAAKESASLVLTTEGLEGIVDSVKTGRRIYRRMLTYTLNKIVKTFQVAVFIILAFLVTGQNVVSLFSITLFLFLVDFVTISLATDNAKYSVKPNKWNVKAMVELSVVLGILMIFESMILLFIGNYFGLYNNNNELYTYVLDFLVFFGLFSVIILREQKHFWNSKPSKILTLSIVLDVIIVSLISIFGLYQLAPIGIIKTLVVLVLTLALCFLVNDPVKVFLVRKFGL